MENYLIKEEKISIYRCKDSKKSSRVNIIKFTKINKIDYEY